jgi:chromosomal replication initiation ATPase DnaA
MSDIGELIRNAKEVRARLIRPPNAVYDRPINLKPNRSGPPPQKKKLLDDTEYRFSLRAAVKIEEVPGKPRKIDIYSIFRAVCHHYRIGIADLRGASRLNEYVIPRQIAIYLAFKLTKRSSLRIGFDIKRDHSTVLHSRDKIASMVLADSGMKEKIEIIEDGINAGHYD